MRIRNNIRVNFFTRICFGLIDRVRFEYAAGSFEIQIDAKHSDGITKVSVSDFGQGIAPENLTHLFDRYFRLGNDNNKTSGLGLGLYISAEIIRLHSGDMGVESKLGKGTAFWFTIPNEDK